MVLNPSHSTKVKKLNITTHAEEAQIYDELHKEIFNKYEQKRIWRIILKVVNSLENRTPLHCLDAGCGTGNLIVKEAILCDQVVGIDISREMLKICRQKLKFVRPRTWDLVIADCERLPFRNNLFNFMHNVFYTSPFTQCARISVH